MVEIQLRYMLRFMYTMAIREIIKNTVRQAISANSWSDAGEIKIERPDRSELGDYAVSAAFDLAKQLKKSPQVVAELIVQDLKRSEHKEFSKIEAVAGHVNFFLSAEFLQKEIAVIAGRGDRGLGKKLNGKTVMVEFTDPNPFKQFHIGHLMSNTIGEFIARVHEVMGARVLRVNWQGDIGLHVAMAVWGMKHGYDYLGPAYVFGSQSYSGDTKVREEIEDINKKLYDRSDPELNKLYEEGRQGSLDYFEKIYERLGTRFDHYFFESEMGPKGVKIVKQNESVFEKSEGAVIFPGEKYGLHTRVFMSSQNLPTYETKELGLNKDKFGIYNPDLSLIVTGNEIIEYFKVLFKVMELIMPDIAAKTRHVPHGMLRLPTGKMSSRTGEVITAEQLIDEVKKQLPENTEEAVAIGAIKYSILKQKIGKDIIFDFNKSLSVSGDSGPYLQYTHARLSSILSKAGDIGDNPDFNRLVEKPELDLIKYLIDFPNAVEESANTYSANHLALYLFELANMANRFYESVHVLNDEDGDRLNARLVLVSSARSVLANGLYILGIKAPDKI